MIQGEEAQGSVRRILRTLTYLLAGCSLIYILLFIGVAVFRICYPYELEWMEGGMVDAVRRILAGHSIYVSPSVEFVPFVYPPLYFYASAAMSLVTGVGFLPLRLVSFVSTLGCLAILWYWVKRETGSGLFGLIAAGFYAAAYRASGAWFDLARIDSLFMLLLLGAAYLIRYQRSRLDLAVSALLIALAILTKQIAVVMWAALVVYTVSAIRGYLRWVFLIVSTSVVAFTSILFNVWTHGWYFYFVAELPGQHLLQYEMLGEFFSSGLAVQCIVGVAAAAFFLFRIAKRRPRTEFLFYGCLYVAMIAMSVLARIHRGGYDNVFMPLFALLALGVSLGLADIHTAMHGLSEDSRRTRLVAIILFALFAFQFAALVYNPKAQLPTSRDRAAGDELIGLIRNVRGEVYVPYHGFLTALAGKKTYAHLMAVGDVVDSRSEVLRDSLLADIHRAILARSFGAIIVDAPIFMEEIGENYHYEGDVLKDPDAFWPVTGSRVRPDGLFVLSARR